MKSRCVSLSCAIIGLLLCGPRLSFAQEPFYKGKTIRMIVGTSAGGGFSTSSRFPDRNWNGSSPEYLSSTLGWPQN